MTITSLAGHRKRLTITVTAVLGLSLVGASAASAAVTGGDISACRAKSSGAVRILDKGKKCGSGETSLSWGKAGATGKQGAQGPKGDTGPQGPTAAAYLRELEVTIPWGTEATIPAVTCDEGDLAAGAFHRTAVGDSTSDGWSPWPAMQADPGTGYIIGTQGRDESWPMEEMDPEGDLTYAIKVQCLDLSADSED